jgi:hypothetical protein
MNYAELLLAANRIEKQVDMLAEALPKCRRLDYLDLDCMF